MPVPLRVPRPGPNVGKVAQCLSHDPWGKAFFLLGPWMRHHRKPRKGTTNISAHPNIYIMEGTESPLLTHCLRLQAHNHIIADSTSIEGDSQIPIFMQSQVTVTNPDISKQHANSYCYSYAAFPQFISCWDYKCVYLKIVVTQWMWGRSCNLSNLWWLAWTWSLEVRAAFKICS